ncbi:MAG: cytochrome c biogenesis protein CcsA, partial [Candidatus Sulfotelmatobacter sp.]
MARTQVEQQPAAATGMTLVVMVGLGVAFLLFMAFLNVVKSGNLLSDSNLLYAALIFYCGAGTLYLGFGITGTPAYIRFASLATWAGCLANTGAVANRWHEAGHPPFASIYEMLLMFVWTLVALTLIAEKQFKVKVIGTVTMPVAIVSVVLMQLLHTDVHPLVPALQSTWLHVHVTLAMLAYAACALSFALAMMFLIQDKMKTETFLAATSLFTVATYVGVLTRFEKWGGLSVAAWNPEEKSEIFIAKGVRLFVVIPDLGWLLLLVLAAVAAPLVFYVLWRKTKNDAHMNMANRAVFLSILLQLLALIFFILRARDGQYFSLDADGQFPTSLAASPFILSGLVGGIFVSLLYLLLLWRRSDLERMLPSADELDRITYKTIA